MPSAGQRLRRAFRPGRLIALLFAGIGLTFLEAWFGGYLVASVWSNSPGAVGWTTYINEHDGILWVIRVTDLPNILEIHAAPFATRDRAESSAKMYGEVLGEASRAFSLDPHPESHFVEPNWTTYRRFDPRPYLVPKSNGIYNCSISDFATGWPAHAVMMSLNTYPAPGGGAKQDWPGALTIGSWHLPARPIWPGFLINTLFYSAASAALWWLALLFRSRHRKKRGRCPACAYSLAGIPPDSSCPECGRER